MKPSPLKGKRHHSVYKHYKEEDLKSAVEWLKENIEGLNFHTKLDLLVLSMIDEAFEDITKEEE